MGCANVCPAIIRPGRSLLLATLTALVLSGCGTVFYSKTPTGNFSGKLYVEWVAPNQFIYRPDETNPLVYTTSAGLRIQPQLMYTDGGSIPRLFWSAPDLGPWDFAPGYIVHDWLFQQHHCKVGDWQSYDFQQSAALLAEAIKTQMEKASRAEPDIVYAIYEAVRTPIARRLWDEGACHPPPAQVNAAPAPGAAANAPVRLLTIDLK